MRIQGLGKALHCCRNLLFFLAVLLSVSKMEGAVLTHRYAFDADAEDSVGGANGVLEGGAFITNGAVMLNGSNAIVRLPNDLFTNDTSLSFELWFADSGINRTNALLYSFSGDNFKMFYQIDGLGCYFLGTPQAVSLELPAVGGTNHLVWSQDGDSKTASLYVNGVLAAQNTNFTFTPVNIGSTTNDCIGGSGILNSVSNFNGSILEFRSYNGALTPLEVAVSDAAGPDHPLTNPGALQDIHLAAFAPTGPGALFRPEVFADFSDVSNVNISTLPGLVLASDSTNVVAVTPDQRLKTLALGNASITAFWQGASNTLAVTVGMPRDIALVHRYSFNEPTNDWVVHDSVGGANGRLFNTGSFSPTNAVFTGRGEMRLSGGSPGSGTTGGYAALPPGMISSISEVTVEAWVTWTPNTSLFRYGNMAWQRIFDFGSQSGSQGVSYLFLTPATDNISFTTKPLLHTAITTNLNINETPRLNWTNILPTNVLSQVAVAYSPVRGVMKMYVNGVLAASGTATIPLSGIVDTNCWLGKSLFSSDAYFSGSYDEFRIYRGLLSDADIAADYAAGPDAVGSDFVLHGYESGTSNLMVITWGPTATNMELQTSSTLGPGANWVPVSDPAVFTNGRFTAELPVTNSEAFYRLHPF